MQQKMQKVEGGRVMQRVFADAGMEDSMGKSIVNGGFQNILYNGAYIYIIIYKKIQYIYMMVFSSIFADNGQ